MEPTNTDTPAEHAGEDPAVRTWLQRLKSAYREDERQIKAIKRWRAYTAGRPDGEDVEEEIREQGVVRANLIYATFQALMPHIYARNPEISISPSEAVDESHYEMLKGFCRTAEIVVNKELSGEADQLKRMGKRSVRSSMTTSLGWVKLSYQRDYTTDPQILGRIEDVQDNIARIRGLMHSQQGAEISGDDREAEADELQRQLDALQQQAEVVVAEGLVLDRVKTEDIRVDPDLEELEDYRRAKWIAHGIWMSVDEARDKFGISAEEMQRVSVYSRREIDDEDSEPAAAGSVTGPSETQQKARMFVRVWEIWHKVSQTVYTVIQGLPRWAREPFQPVRQSARWYPFFAIIFNPIDGRRWPLSDVELLEALADEYNQTRTDFREHRARVVPARIGKKSSFTEADARKISNPDTQEFILVDGPEDDHEPLENSIAVVPYSPIDPALYDTTHIQRDMDMISGLPDAHRGQLQKPKTATEAEFLREGLASRTDERLEVIEDWIRDVAQAALEMLLQELTLPQVQRMAGPAAVWPTLSREDIFDLVDVEVRPGSSGKPNKRAERENWIQFMPLIQEAMGVIAEMRAKGLFELADGYVELLREGLLRFDERLDVERFLPLSPPPGQRVMQSLMSAGGPGAVVPMPDMNAQPPGADGPGLGDALMAAAGGGGQVIPFQQ